MTTSFTEGQHRGGFLRSELPGYGSRTIETLLHDTSGVIPAGTVLGRITASGKMVRLAPAASDGSQHAAGVLYDNIDATAADYTTAVVIERDAEVNDSGSLDGSAPALGTGFLGSIQWPVGISGPQKTTAIAELLALGISVRN